MRNLIDFNLTAIPSPSYIVQESLLKDNLAILADVSRRSGCKILMAQKAFSMFSLYPLISQYLHGTAAGSLYEARLGAEEFKGETHIFSTAYRKDEFDEVLQYCDHIIFNSFSQWETYAKMCLPYLTKGKQFGIRINPQYSTQEPDIYDPCFPGSRLGVTLSNFRPDLLEGISGFHFHTLCEQNADDLLETLDAVEESFGKWFSKMNWINFGGGHHITRGDYDINALVARIRTFQDKYQVQVYLEPGEAIALNTGFLVSTVLDVVENDISIVILDVSAACHIPDVLELPYRPHIISAMEPDQKPYTYRLAGLTCLPFDIIGDYSFDHPLKPGDTLIFSDMAIYTMVKNSMFNGTKLPSIVIAKEDGSTQIVRQFCFEDYKNRLS